MAPARKVLILYTDTGGGHKTPAGALTNQLRETGPWDVAMLNPLATLLRSQDMLHRLTGVSAETVYNKLVIGHTWLLKPLMLLAGMNYRRRSAAAGQILESYWRQQRPDLVVSLAPLLNAGVAESLRRAAPETDFVTICTDLESPPVPARWLKMDVWFSGYGYVLAGTGRLQEQARDFGYPPERILPIGGMIIRREFTCPQGWDRAEERKKIGLDPQGPVGLVLMGGHGSTDLRRVARVLRTSSANVQWIFLCGHNQGVAEQIRRMDTAYRKAVIEFTQEVPLYMSLADFYVGKPGTGSLSEALAMGLPCVFEYNRNTMAQERYNAEWMRDSEFGLLLDDFNELPQTIARLLDGNLHQNIRRNFRNTALDDACHILTKLLQS